MRIPAFPTRAWLFALRLLPRRLHGRSGAAALRAAELGEAQRHALARNLRGMLDPRSAC